MFRKTVLAMLFLGAATPLATAQSLFSPARNDYESGIELVATTVAERLKLVEERVGAALER